MRLISTLGAATLLATTACGGGGDDGGGPGPTPQQTLDRIIDLRSRLSLSMLAAPSTIAVTALDTQGGTISNPGTFTFSSRVPQPSQM